MSKPEKPATQAVAVDGIDAHGAMGGAAPASGIDWPTLAKYPPFQMFIESHEPNAEGIDAVRYASERGIAALNAHGQAFLDAYLAWWNERGYWRDEDPMGGTAPRAGGAA